MAPRNVEIEDRSNTNFSGRSLTSADDFDSEIAAAPDIRVWFPSYESPEVEISDDLDEFDRSEEIRRKKERLDELEKSKQEKWICQVVKEQTQDLVSKELPKVKITETHLTPFCSSIKTFSGCASIPPKEKEDLSSEKKIPLVKRNTEISTKEPENSLKLPPAKGDVEEKTRKENTEFDNGFSFPKEAVRISPKQCVASCKYEENSNGFITVKKMENAKARSEDLLNQRKGKEPLAENPTAVINKICRSQNHGNSIGIRINSRSDDVPDWAKDEERFGGEQNQDKEMVLLGRNDILEEGLPVIGGKWVCPRKNKTYMVCPLKQLRLERWVHRLHR